MSGVSVPVTRPTGRALIVGQVACRAVPAATLQRLGFACSEVDHPYDAMVQLSRRPLFYSAMILSLNSLYREELQIIGSVKRRFSHVEVWVTDTDGRQAALAEALRLGADGLVSGDGLHRIGAAADAVDVLPDVPAPPAAKSESPSAPTALPPAPPPRTMGEDLADNFGSKAVQPSEVSPDDPLLTAEELRALLQESSGSNGD